MRLPCLGLSAKAIWKVVSSQSIQDSWAIAKKTARCAQYMGALKSFESPHYAPNYTFPEICNGLLFRSILRMYVQYEVCSFTRSWDNRGYSKNLGSPWIRPRSIFSQNFNWLLFGCTLWIYLPNSTFVALLIPEIIGVLQKFGESLDSPTLPILPNF